jgi:hypothetical protein
MEFGQVQNEAVALQDESLESEMEDSDEESA